MSSRNALKVVPATRVEKNHPEIMAAVLNCMGEGVVVADTNGKFLLFNPLAERIIGIGSRDVPPEAWPETYGVYYPDTLTHVPSEELPLVKALRGEETNDVELFIRNDKNPQGIHVSITGRPVKDRKGNLLGGVVVIRDTTSQQKTQDALNEVLEEIEESVKSRTSELLKSNFLLREEIKSLKESKK